MQENVNCDSINVISFSFQKNLEVALPDSKNDVLNFVNDLLEEYILLKGESVLVCIYTFMITVFKSYVLRFGRNLIII